MARLASAPAPKVRNLEQQSVDSTALTMRNGNGNASGSTPPQVVNTSLASARPRGGPNVDEIFIDTNDATSGTPVTGLTSDVAIEDWQDLLGAIKARLRWTVGECLTPATDLPVDEMAGRVRASVLECAVALDQLHLTLAHELGRRQRLDLEVFDVRTALAQAHAELVGIQAAQRRARHLPLHDSLTLLPNRDFFGKRLKHALSLAAPQRRPLAVLYLDLDGFKPINDTHGPAAADELLRIVAARLARAVRAEDMVSRLEGEEFACLLANSPGREQLRQLASKLIDAVQAPCKIGPLQLTVRPRIGIAIGPTDGETADELLQNAGAAMNGAKRQRTGHAFFDQLDCGG